MILERETFEKWGYYPRDLKPKSDKKILVACDDCGKIREISKCGYRALCISCSHKGEKSNRWQGGKVKRICKTCGEIFYVNPSQIKSGNGKYCSRECSALASRIRVKRICQECGKIFEACPSDIKCGRGKHCSKKCSDLAHRTKVKRICQECGKEFEAKPAKIKKGMGKCCSLSCSAKARRRNAKPKKTQPEIIFEDMCTKYSLPFKFVGDGAINIGNANPDFIHKSRKLVCEVFGDFWHSPLLNRNIRYTATLDGRRRQLKAEGYKLIVLWESDLKRPDAEAFVLHLMHNEKIV